MRLLFHHTKSVNGAEKVGHWGGRVLVGRLRPGPDGVDVDRVGLFQVAEPIGVVLPHNCERLLKRNIVR